MIEALGVIQGPLDLGDGLGLWPESLVYRGLGTTIVIGFRLNAVIEVLVIPPHRGR